MPVLYDANGDAIYLGQYYGQVVDNADPERLGRVRVTVPGLVEPASGWALPVGGGGSSGAKGLGCYDVPPIGAAVVLSFHDGNIDAPHYLGGWHGSGEQFSVVPSDPKNSDKLKVYESERFLIVLNGVGGSEECLIKDKSTGDQISMKPSGLKIQSAAQITADAPSVSVGDSAALPFPNQAYRIAEASMFINIGAAASLALTTSIDPAGVAFYTTLAGLITTFEGASASYLTTKAKAT